MKTFACALIPALVLGCGLSNADTVVMKTGHTVEGTVLDQNDEYIELEVEYGTMRVPMERVLRIEEDTPEKIAAREAKEAEQQALAEKMKEEGKILYKGQWVTEAEKKKAEDKAAADKKKRDEERAKAKKKAEEEAKRKKDQEEKRRQELRTQQQAAYNSQLNDLPERVRRFEDRHNRSGSRYGDNTSNSYSGYDNYNKSRNSSYGDINRTRNNLTKNWNSSRY
jgi:membrane protein involved in colicin uptake